VLVNSVGISEKREVIEKELLSNGMDGTIE
jgi:hypothetical protein